MEQLALALVLFASFWVGALAGYLAMRMRAQASFDRGRADAAAEIAALTERLQGREQQILEARQKADEAAKEALRLDGEWRTETERRNMAEAKLAVLARCEQELEEARRKVHTQGVELARLTAAQAEFGARMEETKKAAEEKLAEMAGMQQRVTEAFQALSAQALQSNNQAFLDLAQQALGRFQQSSQGDLDLRQQAIGQLIEPLKTSLERVDSRIAELEKERAGPYAGLTQHVETLLRSQASLQAETANLSQALRRPAARGRWGEVQLRRVVEMAGMVEYCDFVEQPSVETAEGVLRPDLRIQLPNQRSIVVDSKVSLAAYLEAQDVAEDAARAEKLKQHAGQIRTHLAQLSSKAYWEQFPQSPEFVVAFLPGESFFSAALEQDPSLLEYGVERRVILATPTTLIALLKAVAWGWKQEKLSANAREIRDLGKTLYDRLRTLSEHFGELQRHLTRAAGAFNKTVGTFESRVLPAANRFRALGAAAGDEIETPMAVETAPRSLHMLSSAAGAGGERHPEAAHEATPVL
jgi:DNA recombination protein RmuC